MDNELRRRLESYGDWLLDQQFPSPNDHSVSNDIANMLAHSGEVEVERDRLVAENAVLREALDALVDHHCSGVCVPGQVFDRPEWNHEATMQKVTEAYNGRT